MSHHNYIVLGAGPAGLQLGYFLQEAGRDYLILERSRRPGCFFEKFPRHRKLISVNKIYTGFSDPEVNLRWDWNSLLSAPEAPQFRDFSKRYFPPADDMVAYLAAYARHHELQIEFETEIASIHRNGKFVLTSTMGRQLSCDQLIVATGVSREYTPEIPGVEMCETYANVSVDPDDFVGQRVLIIGKGNSAFETADNLVETASLIHLVSPRPIRMAWQSHYVGDLRACNNNILDTYQLKIQNALLDATVEKIERVGTQFDVTMNYSHAGGEVETLRYDRIILCTGFRFDASIFNEEARPALTPCGRFPAQTCEWESVNVPGLYFAGTITQARDLKKYMSGFIHGFRYNARSLVRILESKHHGKDWPVTAVVSGVDGILEWLLQRINRTSALWQQPGFLGDALYLTADGMKTVCMEEMAVDYIKEKLVPTGKPLLILTLEFGKFSVPNPFAIERIHRADHQRSSESLFLHPIFRYYHGGEFVAEHHMIEDLEAQWCEDEHVSPLRQFLASILGGDGQHIMFASDASTETSSSQEPLSATEINRS